MVLAAPGGLREAAGRLALTAGKPFRRVLDRLETCTDEPLKLGKPGAGALFLASLKVSDRPVSLGVFWSVFWSMTAIDLN